MAQQEYNQAMTQKEHSQVIKHQEHRQVIKHKNKHEAGPGDPMINCKCVCRSLKLRRFEVIKHNAILICSYLRKINCFYLPWKHCLNFAYKIRDANVRDVYSGI